MFGIDATELAIIFVALAASSFIKGVTGVGLPLISVPVMAAFLGVERAVVVMIIPGLATNLWLIWRNFAHREYVRELTLFCAIGLIGAVIGTWFLSAVSERLLSVVLAFWIGFYLAFTRVRPDFRLSRRAGGRTAPWAGLAAGTTQGATAISAPIVATFFHALRPAQRGYVFAVSMSFFIMAIAQLFSMLQFDLLTKSRAIESAFALIPTLAAMPLGMRLTDKLDRKWFDRVVLGLLFLMMIKLLATGFFGL